VFVYGSIGRSKVPAPKADLTAWLPTDKATTVGIGAVVDTGATRTCIPRDALDQLGGDVDADYQYVKVRDALGTEHTVEMCSVSLRIGNCLFEDIEVIVTDNTYALVGRDILNKYKLTLDAATKSWSASGPDCPA
jgi:predicted aspartyl protease